MEIIKTLLSDFDPSVLLPELDSLLGKVVLLSRIAVLIGPAVLLVLGLWYFLLPPKEANHSVGYRFFWGMSSVEAWRFTQKVAGLVWAAVGLVLGVIMFVVSLGFGGKEMMDTVMAAVTCLFWELGIIALSCLGIDIAVVITYDRKGVRRKEKTKVDSMIAAVEQAVEQAVEKAQHVRDKNTATDETTVISMEAFEADAPVDAFFEEAAEEVPEEAPVEDLEAPFEEE